MITIDGTSYPMWSQFVEKKDKWIGGILEELSGQIGSEASTEITDIGLHKNPGSGDTVYFTVYGKKFDESFAVTLGGLSKGENDDWIYFSTTFGIDFRIKPKRKK
jgi:hypothetical protein